VNERSYRERPRKGRGRSSSWLIAGHRTPLLTNTIVSPDIAQNRQIYVRNLDVVGSSPIRSTTITSPCHLGFCASEEPVEGVRTRCMPDHARPAQCGSASGSRRRGGLRHRGRRRRAGGRRAPLGSQAAACPSLAWMTLG
jgi:hypothetical protein